MTLEREFKKDNPNRIIVVRDKHDTTYLPARTRDEGLEQLQWLFEIWQEQGYYWNIEDSVKKPKRGPFGVIMKDGFEDERAAYKKAIEGNPFWLMEITRSWEYQEWHIDYLNVIKKSDD